MAFNSGDSSASRAQVVVTAATQNSFQLSTQLYHHLFSAYLAELNSTDWVPGWWPFHTNLLVFSSQANFQLTTELSHSTTSYFMSLHSTELPAGLGYSLYSLRADPPENTASNDTSILVIGRCLAIARTLLTCLLDDSFSQSLHINSTTCYNISQSLKYDTHQFVPTKLCLPPVSYWLHV
jgi:hypothetical protein